MATVFFFYALRNSLGRPRTSLDKWSARRRDLYLTKYQTHNRQTSMLPAGFEPRIPASARPQTHAFDRAATETGGIPSKPYFPDTVVTVLKPSLSRFYCFVHFNPLNPELNPICYLLALLGAHHFLHVSRIRVKSLTFRRLMSYIWNTHSWCF